MTGNRDLARVDFHIHSYASNITDYYAANTFAIPESYSDPIETYHNLKAVGMDLVTLTDHNSIDGVLEMLDAGLPDVFVSAEMTASFPEDGCNIHVTVANMTEAQFREVDRLRGNVYEMVDYVDRQIATEAEGAGNKLAYFMTHPLMSTQNRPYGRVGSLNADHIEKALLLFDCIEVQNGTRTRALNELTAQMLAALDEATIARLADKHGIAPKGPTPWLKAVTAGSDDHSGLSQGCTWTTFPTDGAKPTPNMLVEAIRARRSGAGGDHGGPIKMAHSVFKLLYDGQSQNVDPTQKRVEMGGAIQDLLRSAFGAGGRAPWRDRVRTVASYTRHRVRRRLGRPSRSRSFEAILTHEAYELLGDGAFAARLAACQGADDRIFAIISEMLNRVFVNYVDSLRQARSFDLVAAIKEVVALVTSNVCVSLPYFVSYLAQSSDKLVAREVRHRFDIEESSRLVLVTDTFFDVNGVAKTIRRILHEAERRGIHLTVVTALAPAELREACADPEVEAWIDSGRIKVFEAVYDVGMPEYDGLRVRFPPLLEFLQYCQEQGFTKMQISTPGTVGLAGLFAAKLLQIEVASTYHTSFPEYVENYTRDISLEAMTWKYMILFYHSVDEVVVPSKFIAKLLHQRGLRKRKILILDRWVDTEQFHPAKRREDFFVRFGLERNDVVKFVYLGRIGVEKNLDTAVAAFERLCAERGDVHLILVGDGPYRAELERRLEGLPATFTGFLDGDDVPAALASADVKLFPSMTDTWGNAPLEAQAAGLPVIVSDVGGPQELAVDGVTGFRVSGRSVDAMLEAMRRLADPELRATMGRAARRFTEENRIEAPFSAILDAEGYRARAEKRALHIPAPEPERTLVFTPHRDGIITLVEGDPSVDEAAHDVPQMVAKPMRSVS